MSNVDYVLIGELDTRLAIIRGSSQSVVDCIRYGDFEGLKQTISTYEAAGMPPLLADNGIPAKRIGGLIPIGDMPDGANVTWEVFFMQDRHKFPAIAFGVAAAFLALLVVAANADGMHALATLAEFFIDTIRRIPMQVIILFVGLPLGGAVKTASDGVTVFSNPTWGIIAISIGHSAFIAKSFSELASELCREGRSRPRNVLAFAGCSPRYLAPCIENRNDAAWQ